MAASTKAQLGARVSPEVRDAVKAKAAAEGLSLNAWVERALGAALEMPDGGPSPDHGGGSGSKLERATPAPRRAPLKRAADVTRNDAALRRQAKLNAAKERS